MTDYCLTPAVFLERVGSDGSRSSKPLFECSGSNSCNPVPIAAPAEGSKSYLVFYGTGFRDASQVKCSIAGYDFPIDYAGPSGEGGLDRLSVPLEFGPGGDFWQTVYVNSMAEVVLSVNGVLANRALLLFSAPEPH